MSYEFNPEHDSNGNIKFTKFDYEDGQVLEAEHMDRIEIYLEDIYGILYSKPKIIFQGENSNDDLENKKYISYSSAGQDIYISFSVEAKGEIDVAIYMGDFLLYSEHTSGRNFNIPIEKNIITPGPRNYTVVVQDKFSNKTSRNVEHTVIMSELTYDNENIVQIISFDENGMATLVDDEQTIVGKIYGESTMPNPILEYSFDQLEWLSGNSVLKDSIVEADHYRFEWSFPHLELTNITMFTEKKVYFRMGYYKGTTFIPTFPNNHYTFYIMEKNSMKVLIDTDIQSFDANEAFLISAKLLIPDMPRNNNYVVQYTLLPNNTVNDFISTKLNTPFTINFGILSATQEGQPPYQIQWQVGDLSSYSDTFTIGAGNNYTQDGLVAYFTAENFTGGNHWQSLNTIAGNEVGTYYYPSIELFGGYTKVNKEDDVHPAYIDFIPNSYGYFGEYKDLLYNKLCSSSSGFAIELLYSANNIGELMAPVFTSALNYSGTDMEGLILYYNNFYAKKSAMYDKFTRTMPIDSWNHVVINAIAEPFQGEKMNIEDQRKYKALEIYLNGCLIGTQPLVQGGNTASWSSFFDKEKGLCLNTFFDAIDSTILQYSGASQISMIRLYNRPLLSTQEIFLNYRQSIGYDQQRLREFNTRQNNNTIAQVFMVRNSNPNQNNKKIDNYTTFEKLHKISVKKASEFKTEEEKKEYEKNLGGSYYSKNSAVNCTVYIIQTDSEGKKVEHCQRLKNVDVLLQGTSSLIYPVKNYQFVNYNAEAIGTKTKFLPEVEEVNQQGIGWNGTQGDSVYTLKCDYMEQSHKNNTPTAMYYDTVLENVVEKLHEEEENITSYYSPARNYRNEQGQAIYRDSIQGFPVIVYYNDTYNSKYDQQYEDRGNWASLKSTLSQECSNTGSFMFNIDKEGAALGFNLKEEVLGEQEFNFPIQDWYIKSWAFDSSEENYKNFVVTFEEDDVDFTSISDELHLFKYTEDFDIIDIGTIAKIEKDGDAFKLSIIDSENVIPETTTLFCVSQMKMNIKRTANNFCVSLEGTANSQEPAAGTFFTANEAGRNSNKLDYYEKTLEPRYNISPILPSDASDDEVDEHTKYCNYEQLDRLIKFFKLVDKQKNSLNDNLKTKMKNKFESYFSLEYCLTYYLQMLVFAQVDNSGKNAMFDSWNGGKVFPRPYDMDTQVGLDNVGIDRIPVSAELHDSSNIQFTNTQNNPYKATLSYQDVGAVSDNNLNYYRLNKTYNSTNSRLWNFIFIYYYSELKDIYEKLRATTYDATQIHNFAHNKTTALISEKQYNLDAYLKYLSRDDSSYFYEVNGNRDVRYKQFLEERLIFLDSVFEVNGFTDFTFAWRPGETGNINLILSTLTPQYIKVLPGNTSTQMKFFVSSEFLYDAVNKEGKAAVWKEGISLTYNNAGNPDADTQLIGVKNLKFLGNFGSSKPKSITGGTADLVHLTQLDVIANATEPNGLLTALAIGQEGYDNYLNSFTMKYFDKIENLNFNIANYIKTIAITNCDNLTSVNLPPRKNDEGEVLDNINIPLLNLNLQNNSKLSKLNLQNFPNLVVDSYYDEELEKTITSVMNVEFHKGLNLYGCDGLSEIIIKNCPKLSNLAFNELPNLSKIELDGCDELVEFSCPEHLNLKTLIIRNCPNLRKINLANSKLTSLDLSIGNNNLQEIYLTGSNLLTSLNLPINIELTALELNLCTSLKRINSTEDGTYNFNKITINGRLKLEKTPVIKINELNYTGSGEYLCSECGNLEKFEYAPSSPNKLVIRNKGSYMFRYCYKLNVPDTDRLTMDPNNKVNGLTQAFHACKSCQLNNLISQFITGNEKLTSLSYTFCAIQTLGTTTLDLSKFSGLSALTSTHMCVFGTPIRTISNIFPIANNLTSVGAMFAYTNISSIPANIFINCPNINSAQNCFRKTKITSVTNQIFNEDVQIEVRAIFKECSDLTTGAVSFFNNHPNITDADEAFAYTGITSLVEGTAENPVYLFDKTTKLARAVGLFNNCMGLTELPDYLKGNSSNALITNIDLSGLFFNCTNLTGAIPQTFFENLKSKITSLGNNTVKNGPDDDKYCIEVLGAFCNTKIQNYIGSAFQNLEKLTNIRYLFAQVNFILTSDTSRDHTYEIKQVEPNKRYFKGYVADAGQNGRLGPNMFSGCTNIRYLEGCFMGTLITEIEDEDPTDTSFYFGTANNKIALIPNINFVFSNSPLTYTRPLIDRVCGYLSHITEAKYAFSNTGLQNRRNEQGQIVSDIKLIFDELTNLKNITGMFSNCANISNQLQINTFNSLNSLEIADYAFAQTNISTIEDSVPQAYAINGTLVVHSNENNITSIIYNSTDNVLQTNDKAIVEFSLSESGKLKIKCADNSIIETSVKKVDLTFMSTAANLQNQTFTFYGKELNKLNSESNALFDKEIVNNKEAIGSEFKYSVNLYTQNSVNDRLSLALLQWYDQIVSIPTEGLFYNLYNSLSSIKGMFAKTQLNTIPKYLFNSNNNHQFNELENISLLFNDCAYCNEKNNNDDILVPNSWLNTCKEITNIDGIFANLGSLVEDTQDSPANIKSLGGAFNTLPKLQNANYAFANIPYLLKNSVINTTFLGASISEYNLTNISHICSASKIHQIVSPFTNIVEGSRNTVKVFDRAFASTTITTTGTRNIIPSRNIFPNTITATEAWTFDNPQDLSAKNWNTNTYTVPTGGDYKATIRSEINSYCDTFIQYIDGFKTWTNRI